MGGPPLPRRLGAEQLRSAAYSDRWVDAADLLHVIRTAKAPHQHGLRLESLVVVGELDLSELEIPFRLAFLGVHVLDEFRMRHARTRSVELEHARLHRGLQARGLRVDGDLLAHSLVADEVVDLLCADVTGQVRLPGAQLAGSPWALVADVLRVGGGMFLRDRSPRPAGARTPTAVPPA